MLNLFFATRIIFPFFMAIKKSQLYSALWDGCDELRGGTGGIVREIHLGQG